MDRFNIVEFIESDSTAQLADTFQNKILATIKANFNEMEQRLFMATFYCTIHHGTSASDFIFDLNDSWQWLGYYDKSTAKRALKSLFVLGTDYIVTGARSLLKQTGGQHGGQNKEAILMNSKTFRLYCLSAQTARAREIREYSIKFEDLIFSQIREESDEFKMQVQSHKTEKKLLREQTILEQYGSNI